MPRLPTPRRKFLGIPLLTLLVVLGVLYALSRLKPRPAQPRGTGDAVDVGQGRE